MTVAIQRCENYAGVKKALYECLDKLGIKIKKNAKVLIKPNIGKAVKQNTGGITHPLLVSALIDWLREKGAKKIQIYENPSIGVDPQKAYEESGYKKLAENKKIELLDPKKQKTFPLKTKLGTIRLPSCLKTADLYVNVPKMKTHTLTQVTLSLKNQKGLLGAGWKKKFHQNGLHSPIAILYKKIMPGLVVVDAVETIEGQGPFNGKKKQTRLILAGDDALETDRACAQIMGIEPSKIRHLAEAGPWKKPKTVGEKIGKVAQKFKKAEKLGFSFGKIRVWTNPYACCMCGEALGQLKKSFLKKPLKTLRAIPKLAHSAFFSGLDIVMGKNPHVPKNARNVLCIGECSKKFAEKHGYKHAKGCPPTVEDITKSL